MEHARTYFEVGKPCRDTAVVALGETLEMNDLSALDHCLARLSAYDKHIVLDFSNTAHVHYCLPELLQRHANRLRAQDGSLVLCGLNDYIETIFSFMGYVWDFERAESTEEVLSRPEYRV